MPYYTYILASKTGTLYTGITNNIERRLAEHRNGTGSSFTKRYGVHKLVYLESTGDIKEVIAHEKRIKGWTRKKKCALIESQNPQWRDLAEDYFPHLSRDSSLRSE